MIYLYVKQHAITKLKYFGKTSLRDPFKYTGSGTRWTNHLNKHGREHIQTLEIWGFDNQELCTRFALRFSNDNNIVASKEWANLCEENGISGGNTGPMSEENKRKMSEIAKQRKGEKNPFYGKRHSQQFKDDVGKRSVGNTYGIGNKSTTGLSWYHNDNLRKNGLFSPLDIPDDWIKGRKTYFSVATR